MAKLSLVESPPRDERDPERLSTACKELHWRLVTRAQAQARVDEIQRQITPLTGAAPERDAARAIFAPLEEARNADLNAWRQGGCQGSRPQESAEYLAAERHLALLDRDVAATGSAVSALEAERS